MKITIANIIENLDPAGTASNPDASLESYEREVAEAINRDYPGAEVEFVRQDDCRITLSGIDNGDDADAIRDEVARICALVYETGNFWL